MKEACLIVLTRYPLPGTVKSRLAEEVGQESATKIHRGMLLDILRRFTTRSDVPILLAIGAADKTEWFTRLLDEEQISGNRIEIRQTPGDMYQATVDSYRYCLKQYRKAILLPTDLPYFEPAQLSRMIDALDAADVVFHPNVDDGCAPHSLSKFADLWSRSDSRARGYIASFLKRVKTLGLRHIALEPLFDIDYLKDLVMFYGWMLALSPSHPAYCPATVQAIEQCLPSLREDS